jgi:23S rRNA (adenine2503-C2)-methyltransferase
LPGALKTIDFLNEFFYLMVIKPPVCGMTPGDIEALLHEEEVGSKYAEIMATNFYRKGISDFDLMDNIPRSVRNKLSLKVSTGLFVPADRQISSDGSVKYLFRTKDGREFETVFIPDGKRMTVCVSTQAGCRMGCPFCITSSYGFRGDLTAGEILNQVISLPEARKVTHIVFMGMGEPLDNIDEVLKACNIFTSQWGLALSQRNITVSTVGITAGVKRFLNESDCNLTLSLFSAIPSERASVVPAEKAYPVIEIVEMMKNFKPGKRRRFSIAYVMISDINDTDYHLNELKALLKGTAIRVNLLPYHNSGNDKYLASDVSRMNHFRQELFLSGISASVRRSRGADISAACGLLASGLKK